MTLDEVVALLREARTNYLGHNLDCTRVCDECAFAARVEDAIREIELLKSRWQREQERLRRLLAEAGESASKARVDNKFLRERNRHDEAIALLAEQEWITDGRECRVYCIHCRQPESNGHDDDCRAFGRLGVVTGCREESVAQAMRFEAMMREIDGATKQ